ncbi:MAG: ATP synthase F1 subunit gamma [Candidatus Kerfeldbacteria bacterium]|nr:ATP synthase F1 subunit gamma [Candidatus Kerfeldbacteria bacterium]
MSQTTRELTRRIKGVRQIMKITKAMELVAAAKMRRSVAAALASRSYAARAWELLASLSETTDPNLHPLLRESDGQRGLIVVFSPDRGLAGGLSTRLIDLTLEEARSFGDLPFDVVAVGKKAETGLRRRKLNIVAAFPNPRQMPLLADALPIARLVIDEYRRGAYHRAVLIWTDYQSPLVQRTESRLLLPITREELKEMIEQSGAVRQKVKLPTEPAGTEYLFEPSAETVLEAMLTRLVEMQVYQVLLEATASEHAARMMTMRSANDAADDLVNELTFEYNQARQSGITQDLAELSATRLALEA